ncbi:MAG TPA: alpha/beta family hydrolase [Candidatus Binatia bacterium]|nr:alpha/beta family hydrolase [Candidatus Binatia bacterium]
MEIETVRIPSGTAAVGGLLALPPGQGHFPGVVMIPTIRGLDEFARDVVPRLAGENFVALAVNIFDHPGVPDDIFKRPGAQPDEQILGDLDAALALLRRHPLVGDQPVFAWGYCLGGRFALLWPTFQNDLAGAASFHGFPTNDTKNPNTPTQPLDRVPFLSAPVIACFGEADHLVPLRDVDDYRNALATHKKDFEVHIYPGADHGWTNTKAPAYRAEAAEDCWRRGIEFLRGRAARPADRPAAGG